MNDVPFSLSSRPGITLAGLASDTGSGPVGIFLHGFRSNSRGQKAQALAAHAHARGYSWVRFDLAAHGSSEGYFPEQSLSGWLTDALCVARQYAPRPLILVGSSLGAWLAVLVARRASVPVAGLVLLAPAFNFLQRRYENLPPVMQAQWRTQGYLEVPDLYNDSAASYRLGYDLVEDARRHDVLSQPVTLPCPLVILHGAQDPLVPLTVSQEFLAHVGAPEHELLVFPEGDHRLNAAIPELLRAVDRVWQKALVRHKVPT
ncbi:MAG: alpha/beta hydrolase [Acidiferrobacter sp.]